MAVERDYGPYGSRTRLAGCDADVVVGNAAEQHGAGRRGDQDPSPISSSATAMSEARAPDISRRSGACPSYGSPRHPAATTLWSYLAVQSVRRKVLRGYRLSPTPIAHKFTSTVAARGLRAVRHLFEFGPNGSRKATRFPIDAPRHRRRRASRRSRRRPRAHAACGRGSTPPSRARPRACGPRAPISQARSGDETVLAA